MQPPGCCDITANHSSRRSSTAVWPISRRARRHPMRLHASRAAGKPIQPRSRPQQQQVQQQPQQQRQQQQQQPTVPAGESSSPASSVRQLQQPPQNAMSYSPLLLVSVLWGSYAPVLRYLYSMDPDLTPQVLTAHRTVISAAALLAASAASLGYKAYTQRQQREQEVQAALQQQQQLEQEQSQQHWRRFASCLPEWAQHFGRSNNRGGQQQASGLPQEKDDISSSSSSSADSAAATASATVVLAAGLELGLWNFLGTSSQAIGLELSTATKAAFLTQTTAVFTPCLAVLCGQAVLPVHWLACVAALLGSCCITLDSVLDTQQQQQQQQQAAVEVAAAPAPSSAAALSSGSSSSSYSMLVAPALLGDTPSADRSVAEISRSVLGMVASTNPAVAATAAAQQEQSAVSADGNKRISSAGLQDSSSGSGSAGAVVPAVTCSPSANSAQGVVHAIVCGPVAPSSSSGSSEAPGGSSATAAAGSTSTSSSRHGAVILLQQQQQQVDVSAQLAHDISGSAVESSTSGTTQQQQQQQRQGSSSAADISAVSPTSSWGGEVYILLACCCYAIATVRLSMVAPGLDPVQLATSKTLTLAAASLCWLLAFQEGGVMTPAPAAAPAGEALQLKQALAAALQSAADKWQMPDSFSHGSGMLLLVYSALGPGALAAVMQAKGQAVASAAEAQVLYSLTPVMSALLAAACLQGEEMGPLAWLGGAVILAASLGTAVSGSSNSSSGSTDNGSSSSSNNWEGSGDGGSRRGWFGRSSSRGGSSSSSSSSGTST